MYKLLSSLFFYTIQTIQSIFFVQYNHVGLIFYINNDINKKKKGPQIYINDMIFMTST